jgi:hypothetical protein
MAGLSTYGMEFNTMAALIIRTTILTTSDRGEEWEQRIHDPRWHAPLFHTDLSWCPVLAIDDLCLIWDSSIMV